MRMLSKARRFGSNNISPARAHRRQALLECLESRTLLSVTIVNPKTATFTDTDGDLVTVSVSKGVLTQGLFTTAASGLGEQLQKLDLTAGGFIGANLTISVKQAAVNPTGDGLTNVGFIDCTGHAMGKIVVQGDLGRLNGGLQGAAILGLTVFSMGRQGLDSQAGGGSLVSAVGDLNALTVTTDIDEAYINCFGNIGTVKVGGNLIGGTAVGSGGIKALGKIGNVTIGQSLIASNDSGAEDAMFSASIWADGGSLGNVIIGGSVFGGAGIDSGAIYADTTMGKVTIGGDLVGGDGDGSGKVDAFTINAGATVGGSIIGGDGDTSGWIVADKIGNVTVGGSVIGGEGSDSGAIWSLSDLGNVTIARNLIGGDSNSADDWYTGYIQAETKMGNVTIGGNVIAGERNGSGSLLSGSIRAGTTMGNLLIKGNLIGSDTQDAVISARGVTSANGSTAISSVTVLGSVTRGGIYTGYSVELVPVYGGAGIGKIVVNGDWIASSVLAGVTDGGDLGDHQAGTNDDAAIGGIGTGKSKITSITILGKVFGTGDGGDNFGFVASSIGSFSAAGIKATLTSAKDNILWGGTDDVNIREI